MRVAGSPEFLLVRLCVLACDVRSAERAADIHQLSVNYRLGTQQHFSTALWHLQIRAMSCKLLLRTLALKHPVFQAPMAGVSTPEMAAAVTNHGGLGSLPVSYIDFTRPEAVEELAAVVAEFTSRIENTALQTNVNLNFFCHEIVGEATPLQQDNWIRLYQRVLGTSISSDSALFRNSQVSFKELEHEEHLGSLDRLLLYFEHEYRPRAVSFHFGCPSAQTIRRLKALGIRVFATATSANEACVLADTGVDGIVCQGHEAGGHRGNFVESNLRFDEALSTLALFQLVRQLFSKRAARPFLVPAGGVMDSATIQYYLSQGAAAVQLGTAFVASPESRASVHYQTVLADDVARLTTVVTRIVSGKPARALLTPFLKNLELSYRGEELPPYGPMYNAFKTLRSKKPAAMDFYLVGQGYSLIRPGLSAGEIVDSLCANLSVPRADPPVPGK